jgi:hypothetical protein
MTTTKTTTQPTHHNALINCMLPHKNSTHGKFTSIIPHLSFARDSTCLMSCTFYIRHGSKEEVLGRSSSRLHSSAMVYLPLYSSSFAVAHFCYVQRSLKEIRATIPTELFVRDTLRGLVYLARDILLAAVMWSLATYIDPFFEQSVMRERLTPVGC